MKKVPETKHKKCMAISRKFESICISQYVMILLSIFRFSLNLKPACPILPEYNITQSFLDLVTFDVAKSETVIKNLTIQGWKLPTDAWKSLCLLSLLRGFPRNSYITVKWTSTIMWSVTVREIDLAMKVSWLNGGDYTEILFKYLLTFNHNSMI